MSSTSASSLLKKPHLPRCSVARLCGAILIAPPRSLLRALHLGLFEQTADRRRKIFAGALSIFAFVALCAAAPLCAEQTPESPDLAATDPATPFSLLIIDNKPPYQVLNADGRYNGFDVDVAFSLERYLKHKVQVTVITEDEAIERMKYGMGDAIIGIHPSHKYDKTFDFTTPILINKIRIFVHEETVIIHTLKDLSGLQVGVDKDADIREFVRLIPGVHLVTEPDTASGLKDLLDRKITVYLGGEHQVQYQIRADRLTGIKAIGGALMLKRRCIAVQKGNDELLTRLNAAVEEMKKDYALQSIYENWFGVASQSGRMQRKFLTILLAVLGVVATVLLVSLIWNQKLADAVFARTQELQAERAHFQNIFDHASDGIAVINPADTIVVEANKALEDIMGFTKTELSSFKMSDLDVSEDKSFEHQMQGIMASGGENTLFETKLRNRTGQVMDLLIHARTFPYKGKKMVEAIVRDVTERKKIQEMKDTILQDVAHELKTPMAKMTMSIDLLERNLSPQDRAEYSKFFDICHRSITRLQNTIDGILNLSRLESQTMRMEAEVFAVQDVLLTVVDELTVFAHKKGIELKAMLPKEPFLMKGDMEMIRRLFVNIIHNAIKFTDKGEVRVTAVEDKYKLVKVSVSDDGVGLEPEDLKKVFSRFYQKTPTYEGCGIGLTISQKIVSLHNGVIWAESEGLGKGTTMHVMFPMHAGVPA